MGLMLVGLGLGLRFFALAVWVCKCWKNRIVVPPALEIGTPFLICEADGHLIIIGSQFQVLSWPKSPSFDRVVLADGEAGRGSCELGFREFQEYGPRFLAQLWM